MTPGSAFAKIYGVIWNMTEPYLAIFRRFLPTPRVGAVGIDLSAVVGLLIVFVVMQLLRGLQFS